MLVNELEIRTGARRSKGFHGERQETRCCWSFVEVQLGVCLLAGQM